MASSAADVDPAAGGVSPLESTWGARMRGLARLRPPVRSRASDIGLSRWLRKMLAWWPSEIRGESPKIQTPKDPTSNNPLGFGIWALGLSIWDPGFGVWDSGFGVWDLGFWGLGVGIRVCECGIWDLGYGIWDLGLGLWDLG